jgi:hypothetical protein
MLWQNLPVKTFTAAGLALLVALPQAPAHQFTWQVQNSGVAVRLRGVSAVNEQVAWASGAQGTVLRTADGGATWQRPDRAGCRGARFPRRGRRERDHRLRPQHR